MTESRRSAARRHGEASSDEDAVERCHPRLAILVHCGECDVLRSLEISRDLARGQPTLRRDDGGQMRIGPGERPFEQFLELRQVLFGLVHTRRL